MKSLLPVSTGFTFGMLLHMPRQTAFILPLRTTLGFTAIAYALISDHRRYHPSNLQSFYRQLHPKQEIYPLPLSFIKNLLMKSRLPIRYFRQRKFFQKKRKKKFSLEDLFFSHCCFFSPYRNEINLNILSY